MKDNPDKDSEIMGKVEIVPSLLSADFSALGEEIRKVEKAGCKRLHLDVMDGHFVPNITFGPKMVKEINGFTELPLDVHLMISEPEKYVENFASSGADWISVHYEASVHLNRLINKIKEHGCKAGVVLNPSSPVELLDDILKYTDFILLMSVNPGFGGQKFIDIALDKVKKLKKKIENEKLNVFIEMDGGIGLDNMKLIKDTGVEVFVCGNSVFGADDITSAVKKMKAILT